MEKKQKKKKSSRGFTLLELIVVLAIMAVLVTILLPSVSGYVNRSKEVRAKAEAEAVCQALLLYLMDLESEGSLPESWELAIEVCIPFEEAPKDHVLLPYLEGKTLRDGVISSIFYDNTLESYEGILYETGTYLIEALTNGTVEVLSGS